MLWIELIIFLAIIVIGARIGGIRMRTIAGIGLCRNENLRRNSIIIFVQTSTQVVIPNLITSKNYDDKKI